MVMNSVKNLNKCLKLIIETEIKYIHKIVLQATVIKEVTYTV